MKTPAEWKAEAKAYLLAELGRDDVHVDAYIECLPWDDQDYTIDYDFFTDFCDFAQVSDPDWTTDK